MGQTGVGRKHGLGLSWHDFLAKDDDLLAISYILLPGTSWRSLLGGILRVKAVSALQ